VKLIVTLLVLFTSGIALAEVKIAFIEIRYPDGQIHQMEPGGRFSHIAISYRGKWLHTHPYRGVEAVSLEDLKKMGTVSIMILPSLSEISQEQFDFYNGQPYDPTFSWDGQGYYCSELVGKILNIKPQPMDFKAEIWGGKKKNESLGLSPDDIFRALQKAPRCESIF